MAKVSLEDILESLGKLRTRGVDDESIAELRKALANTSNHVVAKAAKIAGELEVSSLAPELEAAFDRFMVEPGKRDKTCAAKSAIAEALYQLGAPAEAVFTRGIRHVQMEGSFGPPVDTAVDLRGSCAMGLVRMNHADVMIELADLLADREKGARFLAARAFGYSERPDALPLLRFKIRTGDDDPEVIGECFNALIKISPGASLGFVAESLGAKNPAIAEYAAVAIGSSRRAEALPILKAWHARTLDATLRRAALLAIAMLRQEPAMAFLLARVKEDSPAAAGVAIEALAIYRHDPAMRQRVMDAAGSRAGRELKKALEEHFE